ncbi:O-methyltransferase [Flavihumibacter profundi]|jgi:predicted O-methyltransferase YrrM|uniref:O-methyltransferase n=1 Tax=Flavihumibacter profundi TaxID=2716883 RepID=UPI001CC62978|nr:class I SAM-dependent methyltransferase [Flavihumibacter profundi]MBZ5857048.1 class I SAM-dependent methyltransferase [Flavihumibacter profundi]
MQSRPYTIIQLGLRYLKYYFLAQSGKGHGIHSPFVFSFIRNLLMDRKEYFSYGETEAMRKRLLNDLTKVQITDFGAGSGAGNQRQKTVAQIARTAAKPARLGQLLFRTVKYFQPATILELGTSLGITTAYLAAGNANGMVYSLEGDVQLAELARKNLAGNKFTNAVVYTGNFDDALLPLLENIGRPDLVFIDGNHRFGPTLRYFEQLLLFAHPDTVIIFDDIHWSEEMEAAWKSIQSHPAVTCTIDLFFLGYVFLRPEFKVPRHFTIRY